MLVLAFSELLNSPPKIPHLPHGSRKSLAREIRYAVRSISRPLTNRVIPPNFFKKSSFPSGKRPEIVPKNLTLTTRFRVNARQNTSVFDPTFRGALEGIAP
jgi:hypothetical protein